MLRRIIEATRRRLGKMRMWLNCATPLAYSYYRHPRPVRIMHWLNVCFAAILLMSGLNIFNAHQALYWGKSSYTGRPPLLVIGSLQNDDGDITRGITRIFDHDFNTTDLLGASRNKAGELADRGFPSWMTLPDDQWLAMARRWHFFAAWLFVVNGLGFVAYAAGSSHLFRDLVPSKADWRSIGKTILDHLRFRHPAGEASKHYNVLQKCAYLG